MLGGSVRELWDKGPTVLTHIVEDGLWAEDQVEMNYFLL